jgi:hypothetical protein
MDRRISESHQKLSELRFKTPPSHIFSDFLFSTTLGNRRCVDCKASNPQWAAISFGALLCIDCSGRHRHLGVNVSLFLLFLPQKIPVF